MKISFGMRKTHLILSLILLFVYCKGDSLISREDDDDGDSVTKSHDGNVTESIDVTTKSDEEDFFNVKEDNKTNDKVDEFFDDKPEHDKVNVDVNKEENNGTDDDVIEFIFTNEDPEEYDDEYDDESDNDQDDKKVDTPNNSKNKPVQSEKGPKDNQQPDESEINDKENDEEDNEDDDDEEDDNEDTSEDENDNDEEDDINSINTNELNKFINEIVNKLLSQLEIDKNNDAPSTSTSTSMSQGHETGSLGQGLSTRQSHSENLMTINDTLNWLIQMNSFAKLTIESFSKIMMPTFMKLIFEFELTDDCQSALLKIVNGLSQQKMFALKCKCENLFYMKNL